MSIIKLQSDRKGGAMRFSKARMVERLEQNGLAGQITSEIIAIMDNLDGQEASENCWNRRVLDEPVLWVVGKDGKGEYVYEGDCD